MEEPITARNVVKQTSVCAIINMHGVKNLLLLLGMLNLDVLKSAHAPLESFAPL